MSLWNGMRETGKLLKSLQYTNISILFNTIWSFLKVLNCDLSKGDNWRNVPKYVMHGEIECWLVHWTYYFSHNVIWHLQILSRKQLELGRKGISLSPLHWETPAGGSQRSVAVPAQRGNASAVWQCQRSVAVPALAEQNPYAVFK